MTAARDGRPQLPAAPRDRWAAESRSGPGGGGRVARVADPGRRAEGSRTRRDAPRGPACATPFPEAAAAVARSAGETAVVGAGPPRSPGWVPPCEVPASGRGWVAGGQGDTAVGFLNGVKPGALFTAPPCHSGNEAEFESWERIQR